MVGAAPLAGVPRLHQCVPESHRAPWRIGGYTHLLGRWPRLEGR